jgi:hypothetical protein
MAQKKETNKKDVKVQDLAPKKDAKGGGKLNTNAASANSASLNASRSVESSSANTNRSLD